jgi:hypothetical protein
MTSSKPPVPTEPGETPAETSNADEVADFLAKMKAMGPAAGAGAERGRLIFAMDATMSRQPAWDRALHIQSQMFAETARVGGLDVQLVFFRGFGECRASKWVSDPTALSRLMTQVQCRGGNTQIGKVLTHVRKEASQRKINAVVYVGDCMEENIDQLCAKAGEIRILGVPIFMFQDGREPFAEQGFREIARLTRGAYCRFDHGSAQQLRELLSAVAVYAAGGRQALADLSRGRGGEATLLLEQLK